MSVPDDDILSIVFRCETLGQSYAQVAMTMGVTRSAIGGTVKRVRDAKAQAEAAGRVEAPCWTAPAPRLPSRRVLARH